MCIFPKIQLIYISVHNQPSRDTHTTTHSNVKQGNIFKILFIVLTNGKLKLKNTNVNKCILDNIHIVLSLYHIKSTLMMAME
jgi:hypothetical protein